MSSDPMHPVNELLIEEFKSLLDDSRVISGLAIPVRFGSDETEDLHYAPDFVLFPENTQEISAIMQVAFREKIPVTCRGGGTGLAGGALPIKGGIVLALERMNRIIEIDEQNLQATVEPGVITEVLQNTLKEKGLYYPPDPSSRGISFIGGNVSTNAGGPRAVKYGVVKDYVLNLQVVLADGSVIWTGANTLKNSTGYNLTQLMIGSEGTLGIITKIVLKLIPHPKFDLLMLIPFSNTEDACASVSAIFRAGIVPSALEFMEREAIDWTIRYLGDIELPISDDVQAQLLIEVDGQHLENLYADCEKIAEVVEKFGAGDILFADNEAQKNTLWKLRRNVAHAVKLNSIYKEEDTVVPRAQLPQLIRAVKAIGKKYGFNSVCYGHAGDGNLHINIVRQNLSDQVWNEEVPKGIAEIFQQVKDMGGTISGEHGIGLVQKRYMPIMFSEIELNLMKAVKNIFDPNHLLNPGKLFPE